MSAKKKAVKRKPRVWTRWAHVHPDGANINVLHPDVPVEEAIKLRSLVGDMGSYIRVRITEVIK